LINFMLERSTHCVNLRSHIIEKLKYTLMHLEISKGMRIIHTHKLLISHILTGVFDHSHSQRE